MTARAPLAVFATRPEEAEALGRELARQGLASICVATPEALWSALCEHPCLGVAVSLAALIHLPPEGKALVHGLYSLLPVVKFRVDRNTGAIAVMSPSPGMGSNLEDFLKACLHRGPKRCRRHERFQKHLNVIVSREGTFLDPEWTFTLDVSRDGCFVHTDHAWALGDPIWVSIREPFRDFGVEGRVVRYLPWGMPFQPPGVGVRFLDPGNADLTRLIRFIARARAPLP